MTTPEFDVTPIGLQALRTSSDALPDVVSDASQAADRNACLWCKGKIDGEARRDARYCRPACRQSAWRFRVQIGRATVAAGVRRLAFADPPYPGLSARYYRDHPDFAGEVDHAALVARLATYDGWVLCTSADALADVLTMAKAADPRVRVGAWARGARRQPARSPLSSWEPVLYVPARDDVAPDQADDALVAGAGVRRSDPARVVGAKPAAFLDWAFRLMRAGARDALDDLFPGSGGVGRAWDTFTGGR